MTLTIRSRPCGLLAATVTLLLVSSCSHITANDRAGLWVPWPQLSEGECGAPAVSESGSVYVIVECDEPHVVEAYAALELNESVEYNSINGEPCYEAFADRTEVDFADSGLGGSHVYPDSDSWAEGDRDVVCLAWSPVEVEKPITELNFNEDFGNIRPWTQIEASSCLDPLFMLDDAPVALELVDCEPGSAVVLAQVPVGDEDTCQRIGRTMNQSDPFLLESEVMQSRGYDKSICLRWA